MISKTDYFHLANFFFQVKCIHGPEFVNATLKRHKEIAKALTEYEKEYIKRVESNLISE